MVICYHHMFKNLLLIARRVENMKKSIVLCVLFCCRMADDLNKLITASSQEPQPFILVGAELGALVAQFYTQMFEKYAFFLLKHVVYRN